MAVPITPSLPQQTLEDLEIDLLLQGLYQQFGDDFRGYERGPLRDRLRRLQQDWGLTTLSAVQERMLHHSQAAEVLRRELSFSGGGLLQHPERIGALSQQLLPLLRSCPRPRIWIADCSSAEDVFGLAILLADEGLLARTQIFATSSSETLLQEARAGLFPAHQLAHYQENYRRCGGRRPLLDYCQEQDGQLRFDAELGNTITWAQYSLSSGTSFNEFQFILCCRPLEDLGPFLRRRALWLFSESLCPFGLLALPPGVADRTLFALSYQTLALEHGLYRRKTQP